ncbi:flagellar hook assembly protein FlgD [Desulfovibrio inopinatus]|uniref:flagellar hook assembly protein FlgD n=1 Tax=Desulfovibrio inopinatus TaxID=102109 RepID=UPI00040D39E8|nr:flagellar hook assembly protein FlgD [Desulfovibrio inopinatus]
MSISSTEASSLLSEYTASQSTATSSLDKNDFLELLVTQLQYQDPLNPMDDTEFVSQLAQFSSLEQLTNMTNSIDTLTTSTVQQSVVNSLNLLGKEVRAEGDAVTKSGDDISTVFYTLDESAANMVINVFDENGNIIRTEELTNVGAGTFEYQWDGLDWNGKKADDGTYEISIAAEDGAGEAVLVGMEVTGTIDALENDGSGYKFRLDDGRLIEFSNIVEVVKADTTTTKTESGDDSSNDDSSDSDDDTTAAESETVAESVAKSVVDGAETAVDAVSNFVSGVSSAVASIFG